MRTLTYQQVIPAEQALDPVIRGHMLDAMDAELELAVENELQPGETSGAAAVSYRAWRPAWVGTDGAVTERDRAEDWEPGQPLPEWATSVVIKFVVELGTEGEA